MASQIIHNLSKNIRESQCFTLMCDECTDVSNKEQLTICMRWNDQTLNDHGVLLACIK